MRSCTSGQSAPITQLLELQLLQIGKVRQRRRHVLEGVCRTVVLQVSRKVIVSMWCLEMRVSLQNCDALHGRIPQASTAAGFAPLAFVNTG